MQGPSETADYVVDTGRHRDFNTMNCRNLIKGAI